MLGCKGTAPAEHPRMPGVASYSTLPRFVRVVPKKPAVIAASEATS